MTYEQVTAVQSSSHKNSIEDVQEEPQSHNIAYQRQQEQTNRYENMPIQIYWILPPKNENFQIKNSNMFHISAQIIDYVYTLGPSRRDGSNEYPQSMVSSNN